MNIYQYKQHRRAQHLKTADNIKIGLEPTIVLIAAFFWNRGDIKTGNAFEILFAAQLLLVTYNFFNRHNQIHWWQFL